MAWSEEIKNTTRQCAGTGAMLKNEKYEYGFFCDSANGIKILNVDDSKGFPLPGDKIIATFIDMEAMIDAGWVID